MLKIKKGKELSIAESLLWIVTSVFFVTGPIYLGFKHYLKKKSAFAYGPASEIRSVIQTGPRPQALKTQFLAEILDLSANHPASSQFFDLATARKKLVDFPLISSASVKLFNPNTLFIDYTVRQPIAWLEDFENTVLDADGYPFPFSPYFTPKNLPSLYFGISEFGVSTSDDEKPNVAWNTPLSGKYATLAFELLNCILAPAVSDRFNVVRIDVSNAFAESYGTREIVVITEDILQRQINGREVRYIFPRYLRLSTKNYATELGNYLQLRPKLLEEQCKQLPQPKGEETVIRIEKKTIDFRILKLAYIE